MACWSAAPKPSDARPNLRPTQREAARLREIAATRDFWSRSVDREQREQRAQLFKTPDFAWEVAGLTDRAIYWPFDHGGPFAIVPVTSN